MFLLDTNVVSELRKAKRADAGVRAWALSRPATLFYISVVTVLEVERGVLLMERKDPHQGADLRLWLENEILAQFARNTLPIDSEIARRCATLHVPDPRPDRDAFIAATALVHGMTIVTRNARDFQSMGAAVLNPWEPHA